MARSKQDQAARNDRILDLVAGQAADRQHVGFVWDDSPFGREAMDQFLSNGPKHLVDVLSPKIAVLTAGSPRYIAFLGRMQYTGGLSAAAHDDDELLDRLIPVLMGRLVEIGGVAAFAVAASDVRRIAIESRIAELQPYLKDGAVVVPLALTQLLDKEHKKSPTFPPFFGGVPLRYRDLAFSALVSAEMLTAVAACAEAWRGVGRGDVAVAIMTPPCERLPSGHLAMALPMPDGQVTRMEIPLSEWRVRNDRTPGIT